MAHRREAMRSLRDAAIRHALQLQRMFWHIAGCVLVGGTYLVAQPTQQEALIILLPFTVIFAGIDLARFVIPAWGHFCATRYIGVFMREEERRFPSALSFSIIGMTCTVYLFPRDIAAIAILLVGIVDPFARIAGVLWGKVHIGRLKKTVVGTIGGFCAGLLVAISIAVSHVAPSTSFGTLATGLVSASFFEVVGGRIDNLLIPVGSGVIMYLIV